MISDGTTIDLSSIIQPILAVLGTVIASLIAIYVPKALTAIEARTGVVLTDQQRQAMLGAVKTAAGILETEIDKGALSVSQVHIANPAIRNQAAVAIASVPQAAAALGMTEDSVSRMIVGAMDTKPRQPAAIPVVDVPVVVTAPTEAPAA